MNRMKLIHDKWGTTCRLAALSSLLLTGCATDWGDTQLDRISYKTISNNGVGLKGYSVTAPPGFSIFNPELVDPNAASLNYFQRIMVKNYDYDADKLKNQGEYLLEGLVQDCVIQFAASPKRIGKPWSTMLPMEKNAVLQEELRSRTAFIEDSGIIKELVTINGQRGWYISRITKNHFNGSGDPLAHESYTIAGKFNDTYLFNSYSFPENREYLRIKTRAMVESLNIK